MHYNDHFLYHAENGHIPLDDIDYQHITALQKSFNTADQ